MKLDTEKQVLLCQKALYTHQLGHYRRLCETYRDLANIAMQRFHFKARPDASVNDQIQEYYGKYLTKAANGDLSFLEDNAILKPGSLTYKFSPEQVKAFRRYSRESERVARFQEASSLLQDATYVQDRFDVSPELMNEFESFMQSDPGTRKFANFIAENPKRWIGHVSYLTAVSEIDKIKEVDPNHLAVLSKKSLTPQSFGATITGVRGRITPVMSKIEQEFQSTYSEQEHDKYSKDLSIPEVLEKAAYTTGHNTSQKAQQFYSAHKGTIQKALKKAAIIALSLGIVTAGAKGINAAIDAYEFNNNTYMGNPAYVETVNNETQQMMAEVDEYLTFLENSPTIPTAEQLRYATELVDNSGNIIMDNLVRNSFSQQFPNLTIPEGGVVLHYNKSHDNKADGRLGNYVYITCQDKSGNEYRYTITNFGSQGENRIERLFRDERSIDALADTIGTTQYSDYTTNAEKSSEYIQDLRSMYNNNLELAGTVIMFQNAHQINYDNERAGGTEDLGDMIKLEGSKIFCIDPKIKTVTPEKSDGPQITSTSEHEIDDDDAR